MAQGIPRLDCHALAGQILFQFPLLEVGVDFRLENGGLHFADGQDFFDLLHVEVGQADGPDLTFLVRFFHQPVTGHIVPGGLMDQQKVDIVGVQPLQGFLHSVSLLVERRPQLRFQKNLLPLQPGSLHGPPHCPLVDIGVGGVNQTVAVRKGADAGCLRLIGGQQEGTDTGHGHDYVARQCQSHLFVHIEILLKIERWGTLVIKNTPSLPKTEVSVCL